MEQNLRGLFERALDDEPVPPPGDPVRAVMAHGRRIRRRRGLLVGSAAVAAVAAIVGVNAAMAPAPPPPPRAVTAAMMMPTDPACKGPVQDDATNVAIFLGEDSTAAQHAGLAAALRADPITGEVRFETREEAYASFAKLWADSPDFVDAVSPASMPESFRVTLAEPSGYPGFVARFRDRAGVAQIVGTMCLGTAK